MARLAAIGELSTGAAHEMNNILSGIVSYSKLLLEERTSSGIDTELLKCIHEGSNRISEILHNLLTFARREPDELVIVDVKEVIDAAVSLVTYKLSRDGIVVAVDIEAGLPALRCRRQKIQQVLLNLLNNAHYALNLKFFRSSDHKEIRIHAMPAHSDDERLQPGVRITVHDNGIGIPQETLPHIFEPFFTTKGRMEGTGLGLSISYSIIKDHGGEIQVQSEPGQYTMFAITLPAESI